MIVNYGIAHLNITWNWAMTELLTKCGLKFSKIWIWVLQVVLYWQIATQHFCPCGWINLRWWCLGYTHLAVLNQHLLQKVNNFFVCVWNVLKIGHKDILYSYKEEVAYCSESKWRTKESATKVNLIQWVDFKKGREQHETFSSNVATTITRKQLILEWKCPILACDTLRS